MATTSPIRRSTIKAAPARVYRALMELPRSTKPSRPTAKREWEMPDMLGRCRSVWSNQPRCRPRTLFSSNGTIL